MGEGHYASLECSARHTVTHGYILPSLCKRVVVYDEICRRSANFYVLEFRIIRSWVELLVCMVLFMHSVTRLLVGRLYSVCAGTVSQSDVLSGRRIVDRRVYMHGALYGGDNC